MSLDVSVPEIQQIVGGNVKVSGSAAVTSKVTYESPIPLVFGFQAVRLFYDQGRYTAFEPVGTGNVALKALSAVPADGAHRFVAASPFARMSGI